MDNIPKEAQALVVNIMLYSLTYAFIFSFTNLFMASNIYDAAYRAMAILAMSVSGRDLVTYLKTNLNYVFFIFCFACVGILFNSLFSGQSPLLLQVDLIGLVMSPIILVSLACRSFQSEGNKVT